MSRKLFIFVFAISLFFVFNNTAFAAKLPKCRDAKPATAPVITQAIPGNGSVKLIWTEGEGPLTHYLLEYGLSKDQMIYGAQNIGPKGTTSYTVDYLINGTKYYFRVHAINNCSHKDSHTVSAVAGGNIVSAGETNLPRLSFFKNDATATSTFSQENSKGAAVPVAAEKTKLKCANNCYGIHLLLLELTTLFAFFYLSYRYPVLRPIYSIIIPLLFAGIFYLLNHKCVSNEFMCQYFYILNATLFILFIALQRQRLIQKAMGETKK